MTFEMALAFALLAGALLLFALEVFPIDFTAFLLLALILVLGPVLGLAPEETIAGFSNPATITVLAMFILSGAVSRTGIVHALARRVTRAAGGGELRQLLAVMLIVGPISALVNNTAAVAILIPLVITLAREHGRAPSKLLMPLSFFSQLGGVITLIGTSTNILASALADQDGYGGFGMFEFAPIGLLILLTGGLYLLGVGRLLLPEREVEVDLQERYHLREYLTEVRVLPGSPLVGKTLVDSRLSEDFDMTVLDVYRDGAKMGLMGGEQVLQAGDLLFVRGKTSQLLRIQEAEGLAIEPERRWTAEAADPEDIRMVEVIIGPNSELRGGTLESTNFRNRYTCTVLAVNRHGELIRERLARVRLRFGDVLLLQGERRALEQIKRDPNFIATEELDLPTYRTEKVPIALAIIAGVVVTAAVGLAPILVTALAGCVLMVLTGCLRVHELYESIRWDVIFLLAGVIPLGLALERTGGAELIAHTAVRLASVAPPLVLLGIFYLTTMVLTELISNNAAVVVMVPVGGAAATALGLDPRAFILAIMFAASTSFSTPVGYQTNTMVFGPGGYRFLDFARVGGPLNLLLALVTPIYIYLLWGV